MASRFKSLLDRAESDMAIALQQNPVTDLFVCKVDLLSCAFTNDNPLARGNAFLQFADLCSPIGTSGAINLDEEVIACLRNALEIEWLQESEANQICESWVTSLGSLRTILLYQRRLQELE
ncbi:MAG: hypothetical protein NTY42_13550 [Planctomycetota bacterium]|nr:hypothetical protein [Planctomycetota bacterium]